MCRGRMVAAVPLLLVLLLPDAVAGLGGAVPPIDAPRCPAELGWQCNAPCYDDRAMDCVPSMDRVVACCFTDDCYSSDFGTRYNAAVCCGEGADDPRNTCKATGGTPAPPPPSPKKCFQRPAFTENQRLSATWSDNYATPSQDPNWPSAGSQRSSAETSTYVEERSHLHESAPRWYADSLRFGPIEGCTVPSNGQSGACQPPTATWQRAMYLPYENRTFMILGNTSDEGTGKGTVLECHSVDGDDRATALLLSSPAMAYIFSNLTDTAGRELRCVGEGGHFDIDAGLRRLGHSTDFNVYTSSRSNRDTYTVPAGAPPPTIVIDDSAGRPPWGDSIVPVSIEGIQVYDDSGTMEGYRVLYSGWEKPTARVPDEEWKIPSECYTREVGFKTLGKAELARRVAQAKARLGVLAAAAEVK